MSPWCRWQHATLPRSRSRVQIPSAALWELPRLCWATSPGHDAEIPRTADGPDGEFPDNATVVSTAAHDLPKVGEPVRIRSVARGAARRPVATIRLRGRRPPEPGLWPWTCPRADGGTADAPVSGTGVPRGTWGFKSPLAYYRGESRCGAPATRIRSRNLPGSVTPSLDAGEQRNGERTGQARRASLLANARVTPWVSTTPLSAQGPYCTGLSAARARRVRLPHGPLGSRQAPTLGTPEAGTGNVSGQDWRLAWCRATSAHCSRPRQPWY